MCKRMISALLALVLLLGCIPVTVLAEEVPVVIEESILPVPTIAETVEVSETIPIDSSSNELEEALDLEVSPPIDPLDEDISSSLPMAVSTNEWKDWKQTDSRRGSLLLGSSSCTVAQYGCLATSTTKLMIQSELKNPDSFNVGTFVNQMNANGGFTSTGAMYWAAPAKICNWTALGFILSYSTYSASSYNTKLVDWAKQGYHMTVQVNNGGHWIAIDNELTISSGQVYIMDSISGMTSSGITLASRYSTFNSVYAWKGGSTYPNTSLGSEIEITGYSYPTYINVGSMFGVYGSIASGENLTQVTAGVYDINGNMLTGKTAYPNTKSYNLTNLDPYVLFDDLDPGVYCYTIKAKNASKEQTVQNYFPVLASGSTIANGTYVISSCKNSSYVLASNGTSLELAVKSGSTKQGFQITHQGSGYYSIYNFATRDYVDVYNAESTAGTTVDLYEGNGTDAQLWQILPVGSSWMFVPKCAVTKALSIENSTVASGQGLCLGNFSFSAYQRYTLSTFAIESTVGINSTNFPDAVFRSFVSQNYDLDGDGYLTETERKSVRQMIVNRSSDSTLGSISSLKGIEYFTELSDLECTGHELTSLDFSYNTTIKRIICSYNKLTSLNLNGATAITTLNCANNALTTLNISTNTALQYLLCYSNKLTTLDIENNTALLIISCQFNALTSLDVSNNTALQELYCAENELTSLDVSRNVLLSILKCAYNPLTALDLSKNTALTTLTLTGCRLTSLDLSNNQKLTSWSFSSQPYTITPTSSNTYNLSNLPGNFDVSKASNWVGGTVRGTTLTIDPGVQTVTYQYDCGKSWTYTFTLNVDHVHTYDQTNTDSQYRKSAATCTAAAVYYKSCECGEKGTTTFTFGNAAGHSFGDWLVTEEPDIERRDCQNCDHFETRAIEAQPVEAPVIKVTNVLASGKPKLTWTAVDGAAKYQVYRASTAAGPYTRMTTTTATSYTNTGAAAGKLYYFYVIAVDANEIQSEQSNVISRTCDLPRPTGVKVTNDAATGKNKISWNAVEGAVKYQVWHSTTGKAGSFKLLMTTKNLSHIHKASVAGKMHYYKVKAIHSNADANSALTGWFNRTCDLPIPTGVKVTTAATGKNKITWNAVPGAAKYQVWSSKTGKVNTFTCLMTTKNLTHTHKGGVAGQTYYYKVKAIHTNTNANSAYSAVVSRTSK